MVSPIKIRTTNYCNLLWKQAGMVFIKASRSGQRIKLFSLSYITETHVMRELVKADLILDYSSEVSS